MHDILNGQFGGRSIQSVSNESTTSMLITIVYSNDFNFAMLTLQVSSQKINPPAEYISGLVKFNHRGTKLDHYIQWRCQPSKLGGEPN